MTTTADVVDRTYAIMNLVGLYGYEIRLWDHAGSVYLKRNDGQLPDFIGKVTWDVETWIKRLNEDKPARGVR
jgi:hypothetical protein